MIVGIKVWMHFSCTVELRFLPQKLENSNFDPNHHIACLAIKNAVSHINRPLRVLFRGDIIPNIVFECSVDTISINKLQKSPF